MNGEYEDEQRSQRGWEDYWELVKRRRWWLLGFAFAGWAIAVAASCFIPVKYKSETVILVDQPKVPAQYVTPNTTLDLQSQLQSLTQQILSRTRLLRIIYDLHLYGLTSNKGDEDAAVNAMRHDVDIEEVKSSGDVSGFRLSYRARSPKIAQDVAGRLTSLFIEENLRNQQELSQDTTSFLESQLEDARKDLEQQEQQLQQFRSANLGQLPDQTQSNMQILGGLQARLDGTTEALNHAEQQRLYLESLLNQYRVSHAANTSTNGGEIGFSAAPQSLEQQLEKLKAELAIISAKYTPNYPDVIRLKKQIADLEVTKQQVEQQAKETSQKRQNDVPVVDSDLQGDATVMQLQSEAKANSLEIGNRKKEMQQLEGEIERYQARLNLAPVREQQLAALTRNYNQSRTNYESLLAKKMQSQMATNLEKRQEGAQFRVLDPPNLPEKPFWPNRLKFAGAGLGIGIALGGGLSLLLEYLNALVYGERDVVAVTEAAVLAIVPPVTTSRDVQTRSSKRTREAVLASLILVTMPVVTALTYLRG